MTATDSTPELVDFPAAREPRCPYAPPVAYEAWRDQDGLPRATRADGAEVWVVNRYEDVRAVLADPIFSANIVEGQFGGEVFPRMDDPEHARLRRMLTADFTVKRVEQLRPQIEALATRAVDELLRQGQRADLVRHVALPVPSRAMCVLLGVPYEDHAFFQGHSTTTLDIDASEEERGRAGAALFQYLYELAARKQAAPGDDLLSRLVVERVGAGELDLRGVALAGMTLLVAGHETTANMIGLSTLTLLERPELAQRLRASEDRKEVRAAVEELLRYLSVVQATLERRATQDTTVAGQQVRAGELVTVNIPAANHDPRWLADAGALDVDRQGAAAHLAFGHGIHVCLGQHLARLELEVVLTTLLRRLPGLRLAVPVEEIPLGDRQGVYGVRELPVSW